MRYYMLRFGVILTCAVLVAGCATTPKLPRHAKKMERKMEVTGYCKCGKCCGWKRNWLMRPVIASGPRKGEKKKVGQTASGTKAKPGTIAADTSKYPFGTVMYVPGYGYGRVEDRGGAIKGEKIDLFFKSHKEALHWGRQKRDVTIWVPQG